MLKLSGLPIGKTLEDFDWSFQPQVDRRQIETLATCSYIREKTNVLLLGPPGVGKSHLATALGVKAIKNGFSVSHFVLDDLMHVLPRWTVENRPLMDTSKPATTGSAVRDWVIVVHG